MLMFESRCIIFLFWINKHTNAHFQIMHSSLCYDLYLNSESSILHIVLLRFFLFFFISSMFISHFNVFLGMYFLVV